MADLRAERFMITGASGMIGTAFKSGVKLTREQLDVTNPEEIKSQILKINPTAIIHLANLDLRNCEKNPFLAMKTNIHATQYFIDEAKLKKIPIVFISSASVFFGNKGHAFSESDTPSPKNIYGQAKVISEDMLLKQYPEGAIVVRTGWVFGGHGAHHRKFVDVAIDKANKNEEIHAGRDNDGSPIYVKDLVECLTQLATGDRRGVFHIANSGRATPFDIATHIVGQLKSKSNIAPLVLTEAEMKIERSRCEVMSSKHFKLRSWQEALTEYVELKAHEIHKL